MNIEGVEYTINWELFKRGSSFFVPCIDTVRGKRNIKEVMIRLNYTTVTKVVVEEGIKGLRVWRI